MRLARIEAVRFGALRNATLGEFAPGLNVVHGPNEAGKSTYTALVRQVLYRYPTARDAERGYAVGGDGRSARLVFEDASGGWVVERAEGSYGGTVTVRAVGGPERPGLLEELTLGVSERAYRTVFGFGLDEMAAIEERDSSDSVVSRLYAAGAGLRVSPQQVRSGIDREAAALFKASGRKQELNLLVARIREIRASLQVLRAEADSFMAEQARLGTLDAELEALRAHRDETAAHAAEVVGAAERINEKLATIGEASDRLIELRRSRRAKADEVASLEPDAALLARAPELDALLDKAAGHARGLQTLKELEAQMVRSQTRASDAIGRTGLSAEAIAALGDLHESLAAAEQARDDLQRLQIAVEQRDEGAERATAGLLAAGASLNNALQVLGIAPGDTAELGRRLDALEALETFRVSGTTAREGVRDTLPSLIVTVSGLVMAVAGAVLREWVTVGSGVVLALVGAVLMLRARRPARPAVCADEQACLTTLGLQADAGGAEVSRLRRALEAARAAEGVFAGAREAEEAARTDARLAAGARDARSSLWRTWLQSHGLDTEMTPLAASSLLSYVSEARGQQSSAGEAEAAHQHEAAQLAAFAAEFASAAGPFIAIPPDVAPDDIPGHANRLREALAAARAAQARRDELSAEVAMLDSYIAIEEEREARAQSDVLDVLQRFDLADGGSHQEINALRESAAREAAAAASAYDALAATRHELQGRLESGARERRIGELHVEEAGHAVRLADAIDRYLVLATASRLIAQAEERYQRERQPEVVRSATRIFSTITDGRYVDLSVPLSEGRIEVLDARAGTWTSDVLSRGAAEQLYLSMRLGLIEQLAEVGKGLPVLMDDVLVNFDPARRSGAARAIAELAEHRQVIFFTCHPETADLFARIAPEHKRLDIPRVGD